MADARPTPPVRPSGPDAKGACPQTGACCGACHAAKAARPEPVRLGLPVPEADAPAPLRPPTR